MTFKFVFDLYLIITLIEIDASLQKLLIGNQRCNALDNDDTDEDDGVMILMCRPCFAGHTKMVSFALKLALICTAKLRLHLSHARPYTRTHARTHTHTHTQQSKVLSKTSSPITKLRIDHPKDRFFSR